jgi:tetratricopeptide (TPR) repeat protein
MMTSTVTFFRFRAVSGAAAFLLLGLSVFAQAQQAPAVSPEQRPAATTNATGEMSQVELMKAYLQVKEELHATQLAVANTRLEAEAAARTQTVALMEKIETMKTSFEAERDRQRMDWQQAEAERTWQRAEAEEFNRLVFWIGGVFGCVGLLAVLATPFLQWRALNRFVERNGQRLQLAAPAGMGGLALTDGMIAGADQAVESSNQRLLSVVERMEKRILELEGTSGTAAALPAGAGTSSPVAMASLAPFPTQAAAPGAVRASADQGNPVSVLLGKGSLLLELNRAREAIACYDEILRTEPANAEALVRKGSALEKLRRDEEALECYNAAIRADKRKTLAYLYKGAVCNRLERYAESIESYEQALKVEGASA